MKEIKKIIIQDGDKEYEIVAEGGSITPGVPIPADTVDSAAIIDGSVRDEDLSEDVKNRMTNTYDQSNEKLTLGSLNVVGASTAPTTPSEPITVEEEEEP